MQNIFLKVLFMSLNAGWMILAILLLRALFYKAPKWIICFFWILVGVRLILPFNIESSISPIPSQGDIIQVSSNILHSKNGVRYIELDSSDSDYEEDKLTDVTGNPVGLHDTPGVSTEITPGINTHSRLVLILSIFWILGIIVMFSYFLWRYLTIRKKLCTATCLSDNVWESEFIDSPFIFGIFTPHIYLPYHIKEEQLSFILAHEYAHLSRKDHILKIAAFLILSVYWFHPLIWLWYILLCKDIELACDEKVVLSMSPQEKKKYLLTLLSCSVKKSKDSVCPLFFGKTGIKERVIRVKNFKKPSLIFTDIVLIAGILICACFMFNPKEEKAADKLEVKQAVVDLSESTGADGTMLYYVDSEKIIFGGYFGLFIYDKKTEKIENSLDLKYIGCNQTQGDNYCEIAASKDGKKIYLNPKKDEKLYIYDDSSNTLQVKDYPESDIWKDDSLNLFPIENIKEVRYRDNSGKKICRLQEGNFVIGDCAYYEYNSEELKEGEQPVIHPLFQTE